MQQEGAKGNIFKLIHTTNQDCQMHVQTGIIHSAVRIYQCICTNCIVTCIVVPLEHPFHWNQWNFIPNKQSWISIATPRAWQGLALQERWPVTLESESGLQGVPVQREPTEICNEVFLVCLEVCYRIRERGIVHTTWPCMLADNQDNCIRLIIFIACKHYISLETSFRRSDSRSLEGKKPPWMFKVTM